MDARSFLLKSVGEISLTRIAEDDILLEPFTVEKGGLYRIPRKPGLGVTLGQAAVKKYRVA